MAEFVTTHNYFKIDAEQTDSSEFDMRKIRILFFLLTFNSNTTTTTTKAKNPDKVFI